jgi:hypothetical protein
METIEEQRTRNREQRRAHRAGCPQLACWGPWILDSDPDSMALYEEEHGMRIGLWWPADNTKVTQPALTTVAFLVHVQRWGSRFTSGLLNAYTDIYGLTDYEPALSKMRFTRRQLQQQVQEAIGNPRNLRHVWSLADADRHSRSANELYYAAEQARTEQQASVNDDAPVGADFGDGAGDPVRRPGRGPARPPSRG